MKYSSLIAALLLLSSLLKPATGITASVSDESIEEAVREAMATFEVPGMSLAVVYDGKVLYAGGFGVLETGQSERVDENTLFRIGSLTKAFTAAALAILVDDGKIGWDEPVIDFVPEFRMYDPWVTREFTVRDLLTHRSGLPLGAGDLLIFPEGNATPADIIEAFRHFEPTSSFRSEFAYDNLLYIVAGEVIARVTGTTFNDYLEDKLLGPLGMSDCVASVERIPPRADIATGHVLADGKPKTTPVRIASLAAAAGGITCSGRSMALWAQFMLDNGVATDGERLISEVQMHELTKPVTLVPTNPLLAEHAGTHISAYALGWGVSTFYGEPLLSHSGGVLGATTYIAMLPKQNLAVYASGNLMSPAPTALVLDIVDQFLRDSTPAAENDWISVIANMVQDRQSMADEFVATAWSMRDAESKPSLPLEAYAGTYKDEWYGQIRIELNDDDDRLWFYSARNAPLQGPLNHFQHDTFVAQWTDRDLAADAYVSFSLTPEGQVAGIRMKAVSPATDFSFDFHHLDLKRIGPD